MFSLASNQFQKSINFITFFAQDKNWSLFNRSSNIFLQNLFFTLCCNAYRLGGQFITNLARLHYMSTYNPPCKAFDFYSAKVLVRHMEREKDLAGFPRLNLFFSGEYGLTLVSKESSWAATMASYVSHIDTKLQPGDSEFMRTKKEYFEREISIISTLQHLPFLEVCCPVICFGHEV